MSAPVCYAIVIGGL